MADINLPAGAIGTALVTLVANTVQVIQFADDLDWVELITAAVTPADIWWTSNGVTPAAGVGWYIPTGTLVSDQRPASTTGPTAVKVWSPGTPSIRVQRSQV